MFIFVILASALCLATAQITIDGRCDETIGVQQNFSVPDYTGVWYETYRYEQFQQLGGDCVTATYTLEDGVVKVLNRMVLLGTSIQIQGTAAVAPDAEGGGKLIVTFPSVNAVSPYWVLKTDYTSYALVYVCADISNNRKRVSSWILSRTAILPPQAIIAMNEKIEATEGLNWETYRQTKQDDKACELRNSTTTTPNPST